MSNEKNLANEIVKPIENSTAGLDLNAKAASTRGLVPSHPSLWESRDTLTLGLEHNEQISNSPSGTTSGARPSAVGVAAINPGGLAPVQPGVTQAKGAAPLGSSGASNGSIQLEAISNSFCEDTQSLDIFEITKNTTVPIVANIFKNGALLNKENAQMDGQNYGVISAECESRNIENTLLNVKTTREFSNQVELHFKKCGSAFQSGGSSGLLSLQKVLRYSYPFCTSPLFRKAKITLATGEKVFGLLALKSGLQKRPLVVIKCGIFCNSGNTPSTRDYFMHYFDQSPFHVLFLGNRSGLDFIQENKIFAIGGWEEGAELMNVGLVLRLNAEIMSRVSSLHLAGISMGGGGALFASHFNDEALHLKNSIYNSITAICPVVDLQATLDAQFSIATASNPKVGPAEQWIGVFFYNILKSRLLNARESLQGLENLIDPLHMPSPLEMTEFLGKLSIESLKLRHPSLSPDAKTWLQWNNFMNYSEKTQTPTLVLAANNDSIVRTEQNAAKLKNAAISREDENLGVILLSEGNHCAYSASYGHKIISTILRDHILRNSPEFVDHYIEKPAGINFEIEVNNDFRHSGQKIIFKAHDPSLYIQLMITEKLTSNCKKNSGIEKSGHCLRTLPLKEIPVAKLADFGAKSPDNEFEAAVLMREFNAKFNFFSGNDLLTGTSSKSVQVRARSGY